MWLIRTFLIVPVRKTLLKHPWSNCSRNCQTKTEKTIKVCRYPTRRKFNKPFIVPYTDLTPFTVRFHRLYCQIPAEWNNVLYIYMNMYRLVTKKRATNCLRPNKMCDSTQKSHDLMNVLFLLTAFHIITLYELCPVYNSNRGELPVYRYHDHWFMVNYGGYLDVNRSNKGLNIGQCAKSRFFR